MKNLRTQHGIGAQIFHKTNEKERTMIRTIIGWVLLVVFLVIFVGILLSVYGLQTAAVGISISIAVITILWFSIGLILSNGNRHD